MTLGDRLRATRQARRMTIAALAGTSGLTKGFISQLEHGHANPSLESLGRIAASLGVPAQALLSDQERALPQRTEDQPLPEVFRSSVWAKEGSSVTPLQTSQSVICATVCLVPGGALEGGKDGLHNPDRAFCIVLDGEAVFTAGSTEVALSKGDATAWDAAKPYFIENHSLVSLSLLLVVPAESALPSVKRHATNYYDNVRQASSHALTNDGPLRLVALREQMRKQRDG